MPVPNGNDVTGVQVFPKFLVIVTPYVSSGVPPLLAMPAIPYCPEEEEAIDSTAIELDKLFPFMSDN